MVSPDVDGDAVVEPLAGVLDEEHAVICFFWVAFNTLALAIADATDAPYFFVRQDLIGGGT